MFISTGHSAVVGGSGRCEAGEALVPVVRDSPDIECGGFLAIVRSMTQIDGIEMEWRFRVPTGMIQGSINESTNIIRIRHDNRPIKE